MKKIFIIFIFLGLQLNLFAKGYALLVGIDKYDTQPHLSGAVADVVSLNAMLEKQGIESIVLLKDKDATKENILLSLNKIANQIEKDDKFYMFFSGHGTSLGDAAFADTFKNDKKLLAEMENSGALIPVDFTSKNVRESFIIGSRDLRPEFEKIDNKGALSLVVFDACFSGMSVRSLGKQERVRHIFIDPDKLTYNTALNSKIQNKKLRKLISADKISYKPRLVFPYKNLIYIASTSASDQAVENKTTNRGYLTEHIEICLMGIKDINRDGALFKDELDSCVQGAQMPQAPQIYPQDNERNPVVINYNSSNRINISDKLKISLDGVTHAQVSGVENIEIVNSKSDLRIAFKNSRYTISDKYSLLQTYTNILEVEKYINLYRIFALKGSRSFTITTAKSDDSSINKKNFNKGDKITIKINSKKGGYLALFSLDAQGNLYMLEPYVEGEFKVAASYETEYTDTVVTEPFGVDLMKGMILYKKSDYESLRRFATDNGDGKMKSKQKIQELYNALNSFNKRDYETAFLKIITQEGGN